MREAPEKRIGRCIAQERVSMNTSSLVRMQERFNQLWGPRTRLPSEIFYLLPSDWCEQERLHFEHYALKVALGRLFFAPIVQPQSILDVGCGPSCWAYDICRLFPHARVIGFDIKVPPLLHPPSNYRFVQGSLLQPLPFADNSFEYVHQRLMWSSIPARHWRSVLAELVRVTVPGGYIELGEIAAWLENMGPGTAQLSNWIIETEQRCGIEQHLMLDLPGLLDLVGAKTFFQHVFWLPVGKAYGHRGRLMEQSANAFFASFASIAQEHLALSRDEYQSVWNLMREEWAQRCIQLPFVITLAQKPARGLYVSHLSTPIVTDSLRTASQVLPCFP